MAILVSGARKPFDLERDSDSINLRIEQTRLHRLDHFGSGRTCGLALFRSCFLLNGLSFLAVIAALLRMRLEQRFERAAAASGITLLREGFRFVRKTPRVRSLLGLFAVLNLAGSPHLALLPLFAGTVLKVGAEGLGWLVAVSGVGAMICATALASRSNVRGLHTFALVAAVLFAVAIIVLGRSRSFSLSVIMMFLIGSGYIVNLAATQTLLHSWVTDRLRGRVMSFYSTIFVGFPPVGSLFAGWIADRIGAPLTVSLCGLICLAATAWFALPEGRVVRATD